jgi:glycerol-3-phosphate acyltransferase PlsY
LLLISVFVAYLVGAIPTGYWLCKWLKGIDIRQYGSGNIGATNSARLLGKKYFALIFLLDAGKAWVTLYACDAFWFTTYAESYRLPALFTTAGVLLIGNAYSCFIAFRGGKGVATTVGIVGYLYPPLLALLFCCSWLVIFGVTRRAFIASLTAIGIVSLTGPLIYPLEIKYIIFLVFMCFWLIIRHHGNIKKWWARGDP